MAHQRMVEVTGASVFEVKGVQPSAGGSMTATLLSKSIVMIQIMADGRAAVLDSASMPCRCSQSSPIAS